MKRNLVKRITIIIMAVLTAAVIIVYLYAKKTFGAKMVMNLDTVAAREDYDVNIDKQENEVTYLSKKGNENFKILAFTDMHYDGMDRKAMDKTTDEFLKTINKERPDLVIFTGDIVTAIFNKERAEILADTMEAYGIYWCAILGNHEGEHPLACSRKNLIKLWSNEKKYPHCLIEPGPNDVSGYGNYVVNLLNSEHTISQSLIFMDSGANVSKEDAKKYHISENSYDFIKQDQIEWYKDQIQALPEGTRSSLFIHIPLCEYAIGWDEIYEENSGAISDTEDCKYISGMQREPVCCSEYNSGLFDVMEALGSTKAVFCGHDHVNDYSITYKRIDLNYLQASGYTTSTYGWCDAKGAKTNVLEEESLQGYTILNMKANGGYTIERVRY